MQSNLVSTPLFLKLKKIQGLFKDLHRNSRTFQGKMEFKDFSRTPPKIQGLFKTVFSGGSRGGGSGPPPPPPPPPSPYHNGACLRLGFLHRQHHIPLLNWLFFFFMKRSLHFVTKLNSRDIQKCNCFWVSSYDLFASACKAVFPAPTVNGVHRLKLEICTIFVTKRKRRMFQDWIFYQ